MNTKIIAARTIIIEHAGEHYCLPVLRPLAEIKIPELYFHIEHGFQELEELRPLLQLLNGIELKAYGFNKYPDQALFTWPYETFRPVPSNWQRLNTFCHENALGIQFHLPIKIKKGGQELSVLNSGDHAHILHMLEGYAEVISRYNYGTKVNVVLHPPYVIDRPFPSDTAIRTNEFLQRANEKIETERWPMVLCLENLPGPGYTVRTPHTMDYYGHTAAQFNDILKDTGPHIQPVLDIGHLYLSPELSVQDIENICLAHGKTITNQHIHGNYGLSPNILEQYEHADLHMLPENDTLRDDYAYYLLRAILDGAVVNYEVKLSSSGAARARDIQALTAHIERTKEMFRTLHALVLQTLPRP